MELAGRTALVTGANRGLGQHLVGDLLSRGARVYAAARNTASLEKTGAIPIEVDLTRPETIAAAAAATGDVTVLINNAGSFTGTDLLTGPMDQIELEMNTHYYGTLNMVRAFVPQIVRNGGGAMLNVLSVLSWLAVSHDGAYCAAKSAEWALTNAVRTPLAPLHITVTALHVGYMETDMSRNVRAAKSDPAAIATLALDAIVSGEREVVADEVSRHVQAGLAGGVAELYPQ